MLNILQVCPISFKAFGGGYAEHVRNVSVRLAKKHSVTLYGSNPGGVYPKFEVVEDVGVHRFKHFSPGNAYYLSLELLLKLRRSNFDVVHSHGYQAFPMHLARLAKCRKFVVSPHYHARSQSAFRSLLMGIFKPLGRSTLKAADSVICVSEYEKSLICNLMGSENGNVHVIPNGVDLKDFSNLKRKERDHRFILFVGRLEKYKGVQYLIEALSRFDDDVVLNVVGKGPFRDSLWNLAKRNKVLDRVNFYQDVPRSELLQMYVDADVFVLLSRYESYSIAVAEALAAGTPCVLANATALSEWMSPRRCVGLDFPINFPCLVEAIMSLMGRRLAHSDIADLLGTKILDWDTVVGKLEDVYEV